MTETTYTPKLGELGCSEAPVSWNVRYTSTQGFDCQLTLRGVDAGEVLRLANELMTRMAAAGVNGRANGNAGEETRMCAIHNEPMQRREKDGKVWYSHKVDDKWCRGR